MAINMLHFRGSSSTSQRGEWSSIYNQLGELAVTSRWKPVSPVSLRLQTTYPKLVRPVSQTGQAGFASFITLGFSTSL